MAESGRRGFEVTQLDPERIRQLYEVRGAIDALAARLAAGRAKTDAAGRAQLEAALQAGARIDARRRWRGLSRSMSIFTARSIASRAIRRSRR